MALGHLLQLRTLTGVRAYAPAMAILAAGMLFHYVSLQGFPRLAEASFFIYMSAMLVGAWLGFGPGVLVTFLVICVLPFLFRPGFTAAQINLIGLACLTLMSLVVSSISRAQKRAEDELRAVNTELAGRVAQKTLELEALLIREQKAREDADSANRLKDEFLATVSHELRGPLQGIVGYVPLLLSGRLDAANTDAALRAIERSARSLNALIEEILDVSRIITGKMALDVHAVSLKSIADHAVQNVRAAAAAKNIALDVDLAPTADAISADANRVQQAIWNLLSNAVKFTPNGGHVSLKTRREESNVCIEVADSGVGLAADFLPHVFERFRQAGASTTRAHGGLGLGLSIVRHIAEAHGGTVEAHSAGLGQGATFRISLPMQTVGAVLDAPTQSDRYAEPPEGLLRGITVLVLDDAPDSRETVSLSLERYGASVHAASTVEQALGLLQRVQPDVLLSDLRMPGEDGFSFIRKVRALPTGATLPAVAVTGLATDNDRARALESGFEMHLSKPVHPTALVETIAALARRGARSAE
jgi:signal transduction histidine kinase/ActR/RegA family two-component response regulator